MVLILNCSYSILAKKRNSHGYFKYIKKHEMMPRNCCFSVISLCPPPNILFLLNSNKSSTVIRDDFISFSVIHETLLYTYWIRDVIRGWAGWALDHQELEISFSVNSMKGIFSRNKWKKHSVTKNCFDLSLHE